MKKYNISKDNNDRFCPQCNITLNIVMGVDKESEPIEDDIMVCNNCGSILIFGKNLIFNKITNKKLKEIKLQSPKEFEMIIEISNHFKNKK